MSWTRMPLFVWSIEVYAWLLIVILPVIGAGLLMLLLDRQVGTHFFLPSQGGNALLYQHIFWFFGHPEVYVLIIPAMGIISEVIPVFARKPIFGYKAVAFSSVGIAFISMLVWAHHMFTVGLGWGLQSFFMIATMLVAVPTGVKILNWLATTWRGNLIFDTPMLFALGFIAIFTLGGLTGIYLAAFPVDWQVHDTYFVVAHFHYVMFGGSVFAIFAALHYWWPKMFGRMLERGSREGDVLADVHRLQRDLLPAAPARADGDAAPGVHVRPRRPLGDLQPDLDDRSRSDGDRRADLLHQRLPIEEGSASGQRPVARRHAGMVRALAAAAGELHRPAAVRLQPAAVARPADAAEGAQWLPLALGSGSARWWHPAATLLAVVSGAASLGAAHQLLSALALPPLVAVAVAAWLGHRELVVPSLVSIALFGLAALVTAPGFHLAAAAAAFASTLVLTALAHRGAVVPAGSWRDYVTLTKPRIMSLLLLTGICGMFVGAQGVPPLGDLVAMTVGLALACGGASALNHVLDRDIDSLMGERTRARPVTAGRVPASYALEFGLALSAFSYVLLAGLVNVLTATLALVGNLFYVLVYTRWLKRSTPQNIVIGGAAGAVPPLVGWAAATGNLTVPALLLFAIVFFWTPPHFWALALLIKRDYAAAGIPMLPVVRGERETVRRSCSTRSSWSPSRSCRSSGARSASCTSIAALSLGGGFIWLAVGLARQTTPRRAALLFHSSLLYLALIFVFAAIDVVA